MSHLYRVRERQRVYAAGFFDGEGCITKKTHGQQLVLSFAQKDPTILHYLRTWIGCGKVVERDDGNHTLRFANKADVLQAIEFIYDYVLDNRKKRRLLLARKILTTEGSTRSKWRGRWE